MDIVKPESVGLCSERLERVNASLQAQVVEDWRVPVC